MMKKVQWKLDQKVAVISLANGALNLLDRQMIDDFGEAVSEVIDSDARAVLLRSEGKFFSGGADVSMFVGVDAVAARNLFRRWLPYIQALEAAPIPTIAAVHGLCLAGGLELALACDVIIAAEGTKIGQTEASIGTTTLLGGAQRIAQRAGVGRARRICFEAAMYDVRDFESWGIVERVVPAESLADEAWALALSFAQGPTQAHAAVKAMIRVGATNGVGAADEFLLDHVLEVFDTEDMNNGVAAFLEYGAREFGKHIAFTGR
jgi:enoyl-CoA hydratase/carnithine racemase